MSYNEKLPVLLYEDRCVVVGDSEGPPMQTAIIYSVLSGRTTITFYKNDSSWTFKLATLYFHL